MALHAGDGRGMTTSGDQNQVTEQIRDLRDRGTVGLAEVVASMADQKPEVRWEATGTPPAEPDLLWWEQPFQIVPGAMVWVATPRSTWEYAGTLTLKAAGLETVETNEARNTWLEILDRKSTRLNSSHANISYAVFCLKKKHTRPSRAKTGTDAGVSSQVRVTTGMS